MNFPVIVFSHGCTDSDSVCQTASDLNNKLGGLLAEGYLLEQIQIFELGLKHTARLVFTSTPFPATGF